MINNTVGYLIYVFHFIINILVCKPYVKMKDWSISSRAGGTPVYLNVYSFCHCCNIVCGWVGLGLYHTAIQIFDIEFMFHGWAGKNTGVSQVLPKSAPYRFEQQILLGTIDYSFWELDEKIIQPLRKKYISNKYDLFSNNCNHFAYQLAEKLGFEHKHPSQYIFRVTNCANLFRCCLPNCILSGRLDWFRSKKNQQEQLEEIRHSEVKHVDGNQSKYEQLNEESLPAEYNLQLPPSSTPRRVKIFHNSNNNS